MLDYDAIGLGEKDLWFGVDFLKSMAEKHDLPFLCSNAIDARTGETIFPPWIVAEREGVRVGFLAVVSPERHIIARVQTDLEGRKIRLDDPTETVERYLPELRERADVVVLLAHSGIETSRFLAEDTDVDAVIVGHYPAVESDASEIEGTIVAMAGGQSDRFGTLEMQLKDGGGVADFSGDAIRLLKTGPMNGALAALETEWDQAVADLRRSEALARQRTREAEQHEETTAKIHERGNIYGAEACKTCHEPIYDSWMETPHATAFARLAEADAWDNPDCIGCHVTGIADKSYVTDVNVAPEVWNVQCEECHGSGTLHARDGSYVTHGEATCLKCHDPSNSPEFDYDVYSSYGIH
jgi:hypothetical protein